MLWIYFQIWFQISSLIGPKSKLDQTIYCQPAIFVSSLAAWEKAKAENETLSVRTTDLAGFSVGEFAAFVVSGVLSFEDGRFCFNRYSRV